MERDGLQQSLRVLQEEYQTVVKEAKVCSEKCLSDAHFLLYLQWKPSGRGKGVRNWSWLLTRMVLVSGH